MAFSLKTPLMVVMVGITVGLTGCGGSDDSNNGSILTPSGNGSTGTGNTGNTNTGNNNSDILTYSIFNRTYAATTSDINNIIRDDLTFKAGGYSLAHKGLLMPYIAQSSSSLYYEIGDHYLDKHIEDDFGAVKNMTVTKPTSDKYTVTYNTVGENGVVIAHTMTLKEIDISGVYDFAQKEKQGFHSWVNNNRFDKLPASVTFPAGSSCFVFEQQNQDRVTYSFDDDNLTQYTDLDSYIAAQYGVVAGSVKKSNVGSNNEWQVVEYQESNSDSPSYAVFYNGKVYEANYKNDLTETENSDITKGSVDCEPLNTTAANTIEQALLQAYK